jgi:hypothetical protein
MTTIAEASTLDERLDALTAQLEAIAAETRAQRELRERYGDLLHELAFVAGPVMTTVTERMQQAEGDGWFDLARRGGPIAERVKTTFTVSYAQAPSTFSLLRQLRDPEVRKGLARVIGILRAVGTEPTANTFEG